MIVSKKIPKSGNKNQREQNLKIIECHLDRFKCQQTNSLYVIMEVIKARLFFCPHDGAVDAAKVALESKNNL